MIKEKIEIENQIIHFDSKNVWIANNVKFNANASALKIANAFMVAQTHDELKEVITQMAGLVNERKQTLFNWLMFAVAVFSALGAILAAIPVVESG